MTSSFFRARAWVLLVGCVFVLAGCAKPLKTVPVRGKVMVKGKPLTSGQVTLIEDVPLDQPQKGPQGDKSSGLSSGTINENGEFTISTGGKEGAPPGKYKVVIKPSMAAAMEGIKAGAKGPPKMPYNQAYGNDRDTPLKIEVKEGSENRFEWDLKP